MTLAVCKMAVSSPHGSAAFGRSLQDLARAGRPPIVLLDTLKWLARFALASPNVFTTAADKRKLLALKQLYDSGKRPLRNKATQKDPVLVANLLLLWLGSLPEPLFPAEYVPDLLCTQQSDCYLERVAAVRSFLKKTEPFILEALFPLFEFLHHHLINQVDRDASLQELGRLFAPFIFGTPLEYGLPPEEASLLAETVELMISEYRPLFTQPYGLNRYEQDAARAAAAAAARAAAQQAAGAAIAPLAPPAGLPALAVTEAGSEAAQEAALSAFWSPFSCFASGSPSRSSDSGGDSEEWEGNDSEQGGMEDVLSCLLESAVSALFEEVSAAPEAPSGPLPSLPVPVPVAAICRAQPLPMPSAHELLGAESVASDDWGSFSPTGFILGGSPPYGSALCGGAGGAAGAAAALQHLGSSISA